MIFDLYSVSPVGFETEVRLAASAGEPYRRGAVTQLPGEEQGRITAADVGVRVGSGPQPLPLEKGFSGGKWGRRGNEHLGQVWQKNRSPHGDGHHRQIKEQEENYRL